MKIAIRAVMAIGLAGGLVLFGCWLGSAGFDALPRLWMRPALVVEPAASDAGPADPASRKPKYYRNPMGLPDVSPIPKKDSMGMDYIPVYEDDSAGSSKTVRVSLDKVQRVGVRTEPAARRQLRQEIRATGTVVPNERGVAVITVKFSGFVESLAVPLTGTEVRAGDPLMRVWVESPELLRKQVDLLLAMRGATASEGQRISVEAAERNLRLFDFPQSAIDQVKRTGEPLRSFTWVAPVSGTVIEKPAMAGMRFQAGDALYRLVDLSTVWVMAEVAERDLGLVKAGQSASVRLRTETSGSAVGRVEFVYPDISMTARTGRLRIQLTNTDRAIKLGAFADVTIEAAASNGEVIAIPDSAVIDSGTRHVAFVARGEGMFEPRDVTLGRRSGGFVEVRDGIAEGEQVVVRGNFLIDAESNLRAALATLTAPPDAPPQPK